MSGEYLHRPVLLRETLQALAIRADGVYVDATFGRGGHAAAILEQLNESGRLLALDRDPAAAREAQQRFASDPRFTFRQVPFSQLAEVIEGESIGRIQGVLLDLGVSSPQLDDPERGFSLRHDGPLDMRMDSTTGPTAAEWLAEIPEAELSRVLRDFGEERFHKRVARAIITARRAAPITTTRHLAELVAAAVPTRERGQHPATRSFQAIRIAVNRELDELEAVLDQSLSVLAIGGRLVAISFHSLEDRLVKRFMRRESRGPEWPPGLPVIGEPPAGRLRLLGRGQRPEPAEVDANPRSRSAILRVAERRA
jgi:16S rRNA (cytosine1402-N4)-methyltransferase